MPVSVKKTLPREEEDMKEKEPSELHIRWWRAVSAEGLQGKGSRVLFSRCRYQYDSSLYDVRVKIHRTSRLQPLQL